VGDGHHLRLYARYRLLFCGIGRLVVAGLVMCIRVFVEDDDCH